MKLSLGLGERIGCGDADPVYEITVQHDGSIPELRDMVLPNFCRQTLEAR